MALETGWKRGDSWSRRLVGPKVVGDGARYAQALGGEDRVLRRASGQVGGAAQF